MSRPFTPKVITANALLSGEVVYLTDADEWSPALSKAAVLTDEADAQLRLLDASAQSDAVVGVYLADVRQEAEALLPAHFREAFRATGPSNYQHGKQEDAQHV